MRRSEASPPSNLLFPYFPRPSDFSLKKHSNRTNNIALRSVVDISTRGVWGSTGMSGTVSDDNGAGGSLDAICIGQRCPSGDSVVEWRSCEQVENGTPSTSPPYWDTDDDDEFGSKPSDLYGKFTWKIETFSQINKRELRSNAFEVGGYKWYILVYPQGCDVCNHLSLFLCVANHEKLLPGWSHFAQFTIAVVNKDPKKSKYSDTLHRFWKKEHDWGWKKFMELSKVFDGFIVNDMLVIKAQVQVIRGEKEKLKENHDQGSSVRDMDNQSLDYMPDSSMIYDAISTCGTTVHEPDSVSSKDRIQWLEHHSVEKEEEAVSVQKRLNIHHERPSKQLSEPAAEVSSSPASPAPVMRSPKSSLANSEAGDHSPAIEVPVRLASSNSPLDKGISFLTGLPHPCPSTSQGETQKPIIAVKTSNDHHENTSISMKAEASDANISLLRASISPILAASRPITSITSTNQISSSLVHSVSAAGRLGMCTDQSTSTSISASAISYQSYRNAMINSHKARSASVNPSPYAQSFSTALLPCSVPSSLSSSLLSGSVLHPRVSTTLPSLSISTKNIVNNVGTNNCQGFTFGTVAPDTLSQSNQSQLHPEVSSSLWMNECHARNRNSYFREPYVNDLNLELCSSSSVQHVALVDSQDEFPHLDIINYLLDEEYANGKATTATGMLKNSRNHILTRQSTFPIIHSLSRGTEMGVVNTSSSLSNHFERSMRYADNVLSYDIQRGHGMVWPSYTTEHQNAQACINQLSQYGWSADPSDFSLLKNPEVHGSVFQMPVTDYNLACTLNGYSIYRPRGSC